MTWSIAVTFETPTLAAPATVRVETAARSVTAAFRRAITAAKRQMPGRRWTSMVILIERGGADEAPERPEANAHPLRTAELAHDCDTTGSRACAGTPR